LVTATPEIATPVVHPVAYAPGPRARMSDLQALADTFDATAALRLIDTLTATPYEGRRSASKAGLAAGEFLAQALLAGSGKSLADLTISYEPFPLDARVRMEVAIRDTALCGDGECQGRSVWP